MRLLRPTAPQALAGALIGALAACQQTDQKLPLEIDPAEAQTVSVTPAGGVVSVPPGFSMEFRAGSLAGTELVTAQQRPTAFPTDEGTVVPGTAFDVGPGGTALAPGAPARVRIAVPAALLGAGDELALTVALLRAGGSIVTDVTSYDLANGILTADVAEIGPVAAVVSNDVIDIGDLAAVPSLDGGPLSAVSARSPAPGAGAPTHPDGVEYTGACAPVEQSCYASGLVSLWVDDVVRERLGDDLALLNTTVDARLELFAFDAISSLPDSAVGYMRVEGDLRARINRVVGTREVGDELTLYTGEGADTGAPEPTAISVAGGVMTLEATSSDDDPETLEFAVTGAGTSSVLTIQLEGTMELANATGPSTQGRIVAHVRLGR